MYFTFCMDCTSRLTTRTIPTAVITTHILTQCTCDQNMASWHTLQGTEILSKVLPSGFSDSFNSGAGEKDMENREEGEHEEGEHEKVNMEEGEHVKVNKKLIYGRSIFG